MPCRPMATVTTGMGCSSLLTHQHPFQYRMDYSLHRAPLSSMMPPPPPPDGRGQDPPKAALQEARPPSHAVRQLRGAGHAAVAQGI